MVILVCSRLAGRGAAPCAAALEKRGELGTNKKSPHACGDNANGLTWPNGRSAVVADSPVLLTAMEYMARWETGVHAIGREVLGEEPFLRLVWGGETGFRVPDIKWQDLPVMCHFSSDFY